VSYDSYDAQVKRVAQNKHSVLWKHVYERAVKGTDLKPNGLFRPCWHEVVETELVVSFLVCSGLKTKKGENIDNVTLFTYAVRLLWHQNWWSRACSLLLHVTRKLLKQGLYSPTFGRKLLKQSLYSPTFTRKLLKQSLYSSTFIRKLLKQSLYSPTFTRKLLKQSLYSPTFTRKLLKQSL
jgi:hypothetical protein